MVVNKILILGSVSLTMSTGSDRYQQGLVRIVRDSTAISVSKTDHRSAYDAGGDRSGHLNSLNYLDSPSTTSAITYKFQIATEIEGSSREMIASYRGGNTSQITLIEILE